MNDDVKYPDIMLELTGEDGNAFHIIGRARGKMKKAKCSAQQIEEFTTEATQGDYDHLLQTCMEYFVTE